MNTKKLVYTSVTGEQKEILLFSSTRAYLNYKIAFGESLVEAISKSDKLDELVGLRVAFAMAKPTLVGKMSFDEFCDDIPMNELGRITEEVTDFLNESMEETNNAVEATKNS